MKSHLIGLVFIFYLVLQVRGEEQLFYYGANYRQVDDPEEAITCKELEKRSDRKYTLKTYHKKGDEWKLGDRQRIRVRRDGVLVIYNTFGRFFPKRIFREMEKIGNNEFYFSESNRSGTLRTGTSTRFLPLHLEGTVNEYHPSGELKSRSFYRDNQLVSNENWLPDGTPYIDSIFYSVDREPEYKLGAAFFRSYLLQRLAESKIDLYQIEDDIIIGWVVMKTGEIDGVIPLQGKSRQLNEFLVNTIAELPGSWKPAILDGSPVRFFMSIPLNIIHQDALFQDIHFSDGVMHYNKY